jgi:hypothetical protein
VYELYFVGRLLEELALADEAQDSLERAIHLQACHYYRDLLVSPTVQSGEDVNGKPPAQPPGSLSPR